MRPYKKEFSKKTKIAAAARCGGNCERCTRRISPGKPEYHHIKLVAMDGDNSLENCLVVCDDCHQILDNEGMKAVHKSNRIRKKHLNLKTKKVRPVYKTLYSEIKFKASGSQGIGPASQVAGGGPDRVVSGHKTLAPANGNHPGRGSYHFRSLKTAHLLIRRLTGNDNLHGVIRALNDVDHMRYSEQKYLNHSISAQQKYLEDLYRDGHLALGIFLLSDGGCMQSPVGTVTCYVDKHNLLVDMGIMVLPGATGRGYGLEAWQAILDWWLDPSGGNYQKVEAGHHAKNKAMSAICSNSGMKAEGSRPYHFQDNNMRVPMKQWGKIR